MITTKQRAYLRSLGSTMSPIFQIGKGGIEENFLIQVKQALEARELIKIKVLEDNETEFLEKTRFYVAAVLYTDIVKILILLIISTMILI